MIGVLGGMGPAATIDFVAKLIRLTPARVDQDHLPLIVLSDPRVPDRVAPILEGRGPSPLPAMLAGLRKLEDAGAGCIVIPCHTAHYWYDDLAAATALPILHIVDAVLAELSRQEVPPGQVGLLATRATLKARLYQDRLAAAGHPCLEPEPAEMQDLVEPAIALVKQDRAALAAPLLDRAVRRLHRRGAQITLLACTELPVAAACAGSTMAPFLDATEALARACIAWYRGFQSADAPRPASGPR